MTLESPRRAPDVAHVGHGSLMALLPVRNLTASGMGDTLPVLRGSREWFGQVEFSYTSPDEWRSPRDDKSEECRVFVLDDRVAHVLREDTDGRAVALVAGCAERMAQLFTGLNGDAVEREGDVDHFIHLLNALWDSEAPVDVFASATASLDAFPELRDDEAELVDVGEIYAFYAVLAARHACAYRLSGDVEEAVQCAHVALTAMGQLDQNARLGGFVESERGSQLVDVGLRPVGDESAADRRRLVARRRGLERLEAVRNRIAI